MSSQLGSFEKILRVGEGRRMKRLAEQAAYITWIEPEFRELSDEEVRNKTVEFRQRLENGETRAELLVEAFAAVREARLRESDQRMFDVQLMGGIVLHEGDVAEMKTGEGKTFVASLALYLNALEGRGVHLVTVNDYLAKRDAEWNRGVYERLGVTVGSIENLMPFAERREAYEADITYGTNSEFGFDYLRDNIYDPHHVQLVNHRTQALKAQALYKRDVDYLVTDDGEVKIIDEFTGRTMEGRRWSEGLHQAIEAKEGVAIKEENVTLATITLQNYFRLYDKLSGMTGTALTEAQEFMKIYKVPTVEIPTNVEMIRADPNDSIS